MHLFFEGKAGILRIQTEKGRKSRENTLILRVSG